MEGFIVGVMEFVEGGEDITGIVAGIVTRVVAGGVTREEGFGLYPTVVASLGGGWCGSGIVKESVVVVVLEKENEKMNVLMEFLKFVVV